MRWNRLGAALLPLALVVPAAALAAEPATNAAPGAANAAAPAATASPEAARPVLVVENANLDVGKVKEGTEAVAVFKLKNTGAGELRILSAKPG
jgi:hypothetical protein